MNSSESYKVVIKINQPLKGVRLCLVNGSLETIFDNTSSELVSELTKGVYQLKIYYLNYFQEKFFTVDKELELNLDINYAITPPVLGFYNYNEYYTQQTEIYNQTSTLKLNGADSPDFLLFAALYDKNNMASEAPSEWAAHYSIFNIDESVKIQLDSNNCKIDNQEGFLIFSTWLDEGLYFLKYSAHDLVRIFPLYIYSNYQTQFFIRYLKNPDFNSCRFFFFKDYKFNKKGEEYLVLEKIINAYSNFTNFELIGEEDNNIIQSQPYLSALVNILISSLPAEIKKNSRFHSASLYQNFEQLNLPDVQYATSSSKELFQLSDTPPLLSFMVVKCTHQPNNELLVKPASILDRIVDSLHYELFWNNFSKIDQPENWIKIYDPLLKTIEKSPKPLFRAARNIVNSIIMHLNPRYDTRLNQLVGKLNLEAENADKFNELLSKVKGLAEMSEKFGLPPTTILRNYKKYSEFYSKIIDNEHKNS